ncbi:ornithine decarboxylase antizyme-domain-containing protein, partial [Lophiotrema nucula]
KARRGGAAYHITEECERLFCETLRAVFLGEGNLARQDSLVTDMQKEIHNTTIKNDYGTPYIDRMMDSPSPEIVNVSEFGIEGMVTDWVQIWDYVGGNKFMGFVAENEGEKSMFVFFEQAVIGSDLKTALMGLLELCDIPYFSCSKLVACLDRKTDTRATDTLVKDLGWIGFQLTTLQEFTSGDEITSDRWLFMDMDV